MKHTLVIPALSNDSKSQRKIRKNISRFLILAALSVAFTLAIWAIVRPFTTSLLGTGSNTAALPVQTKTGVMLGSVWAEGLTVRAPDTNFHVAPVFDAHGAVVSNPTGMTLYAHPAISLPAGRMLGSVWAEGLTVRAPAANFNLAPASIPSGTFLNAPPAASLPAGRMLGSVWDEGMTVRASTSNLNLAPASIPTSVTLNAHPAISLPAGVMLGSVWAEVLTVQVPTANFTIAPVFDATGAIVSDPSGIIL